MFVEKLALSEFTNGSDITTKPMVSSTISRFSCCHSVPFSWWLGIAGSPSKTEDWKLLEWKGSVLAQFCFLIEMFIFVRMLKWLYDYLNIAIRRLSSRTFVTNKYILSRAGATVVFSGHRSCWPDFQTAGSLEHSFSPAITNWMNANMLIHKSS